MGNITFNITGGTPNFHVELIPDVGTTWDYAATGIYTITDIPDGTYCIQVTDGVGCVAEECDVYVNCATTTTTIEPTTTTTTQEVTTTTTTEEVTTTTTTIECLLEYVILENSCVPVTTTTTTIP